MDIRPDKAGNHYQNADTHLLQDIKSGKVQDFNLQILDDELVVSSRDGGRRVHLAGEKPALEKTVSPKTLTNDLSGFSGKLDELENHARMDMFIVMALMHKISQQNRSQAREFRHTAMEQQMSALHGQAEQIRAAGDKMFAGAMISGAMQIGVSGGSAVVGAGAAFKNIKGMKLEKKAEGFGKRIDKMRANIPKSLDKMGANKTKIGSHRGLSTRNGAGSSNRPSWRSAKKYDAKELQSKMKEMEVEQQTTNDLHQTKISGKKWEYANSVMLTVTQGMGFMGRMASSGQDKSAKYDEAVGKEFEAEAQKASTHVSDQQELMRTYLDTIKLIKDKYQSMEQTNAETLKSILRA